MNIFSFENLSLSWRWGIGDTLSPGALISLIFFVSVLLWGCRNRLKVVLFGVLYLNTVFSWMTIVALGLFASFLNSGSFLYFARLLYGVIGLFSIILGIVFFRLWVLFPSRPLKALHGEEKNPSVRSKLIEILFNGLLILGAIVSALFFSSLAAVFVPRAEVTATIYTLILEERLLEATGISTLYSLFYIFPMLIFFILILVGKSLKKGVPSVAWVSSVGKIAGSGMFFALGFGLLYIVIFH